MRIDRRTLPVAVVLGAFAVSALAVAAASLATGSRDESPRFDHRIRVATSRSPLYDARVDLAARSGTDVLDVRLTLLAEAGWDGCLGIREPGRACPAILLGGYLALFEAAGETSRYHVAGDQLVGPVDPAMAAEGVEVPANLRVDLTALLAEYARHEHAHRVAVPPGAVTIEWIVPTTFGNRCLGFRPAGEACTEKGPLSHGALVRLSVAAPPALYSVSPFGVVFHDPRSGSSFVEPDPGDRDVQSAMRADLARRLGLDVRTVSVVSFRRVTWSDGCLGVHRPGVGCTEALVDGFLALLGAPDRSYRYHGAGPAFIATDFEDGATIDDPLPE